MKIILHSIFLESDIRIEQCVQGHQDKISFALSWQRKNVLRHRKVFVVIATMLLSGIFASQFFEQVEVLRYIIGGSALMAIFLILFDSLQDQKRLLQSLHTFAYQEKEMEDNQNSAHAMSQKLTNASGTIKIGRHASEILHAVRNTLTNIVNYNELISMTLETDKAFSKTDKDRLADYTDAVAKNAFHMENIIVIIQIMQQPKAQVLQNQFESLLLHEFMHETKENIEVFLKLTRATLTIAPISNTLTVKVIAIAIKQILINLIMNAISAYHDDSSNRHVAIDIECVDQFVSIRVRDQGSGIPEPLRQKLFMEPFTTKINGSGTGLIQSSKFADLHKGSLTLESSKIGVGSVFLLCLPVS